jgi:hypothetical protein
MKGDSVTAYPAFDPRGRTFVVHGTGPAWQLCVLFLVRSRRLELPRELPHSDLNAARLPIPPRPHAV